MAIFRSLIKRRQIGRRHQIDFFPSDASPSTTFDYYTGSDTRTIAATFVTPYKFEVSFADLGVNGSLDLYLGRFFAFKAIRSVELDGSLLTAGSGYTFDSIHNLLTSPTPRDGFAPDARAVARRLQQ